MARNGGTHRKARLGLCLFLFSPARIGLTLIPPVSTSIARRFVARLTDSCVWKRREGL